MVESKVPKIKRIEKNKKIRIPFLNILLVVACVFFLILSTFVHIKLVHPIITHDVFSNNELTKEDFWYTYFLIPQIPAVLFVTGLMGKKLGMTSVVLYILLGLFGLPIFALGGGIGYFMQYGFGYILAYIPAVCIVGSMLKEDCSIKNILKSVLYGVLVIHLLGIFYMLFLVVIKHGGFEFIKGWVLTQSFLKIAYDYILSVLFVYFAKYGNKYINYLIG